MAINSNQIGDFNKFGDTEEMCSTIPVKTLRPSKTFQIFKNWTLPRMVIDDFTIQNENWEEKRK